MIQLLAGDARDVLPTLAADSVHTVCTSPPYYALRSYLDAAHPDKHREIGSESSPDEYLATMVAVFREVRRVLRPDGCAFVNIGDSYVGGGGFSAGAPSSGTSKSGVYGNLGALKAGGIPSGNGLKPKDLLLMPARLALALQADGWWVRSAIVWAKPNPMPESVSDRPTSAYEMVYLLTKRATYYYDADAVREPHDAPSIGNRMDHFSKREQPRGEAPDAATRPAFANSAGGREYNPAGRNLRNVWTIATSPFSAAHFATFPPELAERCIRAGTSERGCCAACGKPWGRVTERTAMVIDRSERTHPMGRTRSSGTMLEPPTAVTTGWTLGCGCNAGDPVPCRVLDPFAGAGTTLLVADRLQRDAIGIELNVAYTEMAMERCRADAPLFTSFPPAEDPEESRMADLFADAAE